MTLAEQVHAQALLMSRDAADDQPELLQTLCRAAVADLARRLRGGLTPEDCKADFVASASLFALAARAELDDMAQLEQFTAGDITLRQKGGNAAAGCLRYQAELLIAPYLQDRFCFRGV